ncbi:CHAT domain-containing protein [Chryseolinea serpens]|uniref:CHAT domain-containing protein n=1 Tax=Chryseolinea serpens TaxID=947013 RepID=A0A1M5JV52_9BACT|nr:CHAT domain-containing protein [Chryseolinea serpens]
MENFLEAVRLNEKAWNSWSNLGMLYYEQGEREKSLYAFEKFIEFSPDNDATLALKNFAKDELKKNNRSIPATRTVSPKSTRQITLSISKDGKKSLIFLENDTDKDATQIQEMIFEFIEKNSWIDAFLYLRDNPDLLSIVVSTWLEVLYNSESDEERRNVYHENLTLLRKCSESSPVAVFSEAMSIPPMELELVAYGIRHIQPKLMELFSVTTLEEKKEVIRKFPELLRDHATLPLLAYTKAIQQDEGAIQEFDWHIWLIRQLQEHGLDAIVSDDDSGRTLKDANTLLTNALELLDYGVQTDDVNTINKSIQTFESLRNRPGHDQKFHENVDIHIAIGLISKYKIRHIGEDWDKGIQLLLQSLRNVVNGSWDHVLTIVNISTACIYHFEVTSDIADLNNAINILEDALRKLPVDVPHYPKILNNLGSLLFRRGEFLKRISDVDRAIAIYKQALNQKSEDSLSFAQTLNNLAISYLERFEVQRRVSDLNSAQECFTSMKKNDGLSKNDLTNIAIGLGRTFRHQASLLSDPSILDKSIAQYCEALAYTDSSSSSYFLTHNNLNNAYRDAFQLTGNIENLNQAVLSGREATTYVNSRTHYFAMYQENLAKSLTLRYDATDSEADLNEAISLYQSILNKANLSRVNTCTCWANLAIAYQCKYMRSRAVIDLEKSIKASHQAMMEVNPLEQSHDAIQICYNLGNTFFLLNEWEACVNVLDKALYALDTIYAMQVTMNDQESALQQSYRIHKMAAYAMCMIGRENDAVVIAEKWKARILKQSLDLHYSNVYTLLEKGHVSLAEKYRLASESLTQLIGLGNRETGNSHITARIEAARRNLHQIIDTIRSQPGLESFFSDLTIHDIYGIAHDTPLLYTIISEHGGFALIVPQDQHLLITKIFLPDLKSHVIDAKVNDYLNAYQAWQKNTGKQFFRTWLQQLEELTRWVWESLIGAILPLVKNYQKLVVIPSDLLAYIPLHAGWSEAEKGRTYATDLLDWRFAPSAKSLKVSLARKFVSKEDSLMIVENPEPSSAPFLPYASLETFVAKSVYTKPEHLKGQGAQVEDVAECIQNNAVLHFCCHAFTNISEPSESGLVLANDRVLTLSKLSALNLWKVRLVVVSACETGVVGFKLPDEAFSLATGFISIGAAGVVASLWSVSDLSTSIIFIKFYSLWKTENHEPSKALQLSQLWLRDATNEVLAEFFDELKDKVPATEEAAGLLDQKRKEYILKEDQMERPFSHPFYWAGFIFLGS